MTRIYLLVEGQTEEVFVNEVLAPYYVGSKLYLTPVVIKTRRNKDGKAYKGGGATYGKIKGEAEKLCKQDRQAYVTTMFDLYALPDDFPGRGGTAYPSLKNGRQKAEYLEGMFGEDINQPNFIPNLMVHEFEALLFTEMEAFEEWLDDDDALQPLRIIRETTAPEDINDGPDSAPSKRILKVMPRYDKAFHGPLIACDIGLDAIRSACPHFDGWLNKLERLSVLP